MVTQEASYEVFTSNRPNAKDEDRSSETSLRNNQSEMTIIGVYDGHGGHHTSSYVSTMLPEMISNSIRNNGGSSITEILREAFIQVDDRIVRPFKERFQWHMRIPIKRLRRKMVDETLRREVSKEVALRARSGSTALVAVIDPEYIHLANVGDCRAVLGRQLPIDGTVKAYALTTDLDGHNERERSRI